jgi:hypothetical protein
MNEETDAKRETHTGRRRTGDREKKTMHSCHRLARINPVPVPLPPDRVRSVPSSLKSAASVPKSSKAATAENKKKK